MVVAHCRAYDVWTIEKAVLLTMLSSHQQDRTEPIFMYVVSRCDEITKFNHSLRRVVVHFLTMFFEIGIFSPTARCTCVYINTVLLFSFYYDI